MLGIINNNKRNDLIWFRKKNWTLKNTRYDNKCIYEQRLNK